MALEMSELQKPINTAQLRAMALSKNLGMTEMKKADDSITEALAVLNPSEDRASIPEQVFVTYYLPYFSGNMPEQVAKNEKLIHDLVSHWVAVAGGPHMEMDVVGDDGKVLFTVPAIFSTEKLKTIGLTGRGLLDTSAEFAQRRGQSPVAASIWWTKKLAERAAQILPVGWDAPETAQFSDNPRWQEIFNRYKVKPPKDVKVEEKEIDHGVDDLLYD